LNVEFNPNYRIGAQAKQWEKLLKAMFLLACAVERLFRAAGFMPARTQAGLRPVALNGRSIVTRSGLDSKSPPDIHFALLNLRGSDAFIATKNRRKPR
jgi:hypothetical protein